MQSALTSDLALLGVLPGLIPGRFCCPPQMTPEQLAHIKELPELIAKEKNVDKLVALAAELIELLDLELQERRQDRHK
jgi:hypothetical protein